jgi:hypothetical protein
MELLAETPVFASLHCLNADLRQWKVDGIIGLDVLCGKTWLASFETKEKISDKNITIDFDSRKICFVDAPDAGNGSPAAGRRFSVDRLAPLRASWEHN